MINIRLRSRIGTQAVLVVVLGGVPHVAAQGLTGQISGLVVDASQAVLPGAAVVVRNTGTNFIRETVTDADGTYVFPDLLAGTYEVKVSLSGFKTYTEAGIVLGATERVALRRIALAVGQIEETVTVAGESPLVQTQSSARSGLIERQQMEDIALKGRDFAGLLRLLPGVVDTSSRDAPGWGSMGGLTINGRSGGFNFAYDGVTNKDTGSNSGNWSAPALDSIGEVRVQTANFQAEYGRSSGATITVVTRSGTRDFHGSAAYYKRDDAFNGNEYSRRQQGLPASSYKFDNAAWTIGGPVLLPGGFNRERNHLFFFWSQDLLARTDPGNLNQRRVPTELERRGDFSQTFDSQGRLIFIRDPLQAGACNSVTGGPACFPGNLIPANRIDPIGRALINMLPAPNAIDPTGARQYNYAFQTVQDWPRNDQVLRVDWNIAPRTTFYSRLQYGYEKRSGPVSFLGSSGGWPQYPTKYEIDTLGVVNTLLHTFNATTFSEVTVGVNWAHQYTSPFDQAAQDQNDRTKVLPGLPQFFPAANPLNVLPQATFTGGVPALTNGIASIGVEQRFPFFGYNALWNFSGNISKLKASHTMKAGLFVEHTTRPAARSSSFNGTLSFNTDTSNPGNTNIGFANALLGSVTQYQESNAHPTAHGAFMNVEWYGQDTWRVTRRLTIDGGLRFYAIAPTRSQGDQLAMFVPSEWSLANAPQLIQPLLVGNTRLGRNPVTGEMLPAVYIGRIASGAGDPFVGMHLFDETVMKNPPIQIAPRLGFAWDLTGDARTAVRGGAGAFYDRYSDDEILQLVEQPPLLDTRTTNYTTIKDLLSNTLTGSPKAVRYNPNFIPPVVYNWSMGIQRELGFRLAADVAYVGNAARHQLISREINGQPYGYRFIPTSLDGTNVQAGQAQPLPDDFLRAYRGYSGITQREFSGDSTYHSLQVSLNRRRVDGLSFGVSYTLSKSMSLAAIDPFIADNRARNYTRTTGNNGNRPHALVISYSYDVPNLSHKWDHAMAKAIFDNWQVSGITSAISGTNGSITYSFTGVPTGALVGTGALGAPTAGGGSAALGGSRVDFVCDPNLPARERTFDRQFATECVQPPADAMRLGNGRGDELLGPGYLNWDISFFKSVPLKGTRRLQLRVELYNAFNTDQWSAIDTAAVFDYLTGKQTNTNFGRLTGATRDARRVQLGARLTF
ncbi:MAG: hypothetical protein AUH43_06635 [Acidobacteria bacterium 13_1_40CM_65_14]|nr:MAG: hypothetical protein AUH43_06635 [Acidobacteria bacterium 13_1_40CM_65_14]